MCGEEPSGLNSLPAGRGDEKADRRQPQVLELSGSTRAPRTRLGRWRLPAGIPRFGFTYLLGAGRTCEISPPAGTHPMQQTVFCS